MKTKLLKKIRKRFSIIKVDELGSSPCCFYEKCYKKYGLPFFYIQDKELRFFSEYEDGFKTIEDAMDALSKTIVNIYSESFRHKDDICSIVWYKK